jgi:large subunit ribosomal protein L1
MKHSKRYRALVEKINRTKTYSLEEAIDQVKAAANAKFDETVEVAIRLGVDAKKTEQLVRGTSALPHGTGKSIKVLVLTKGEKEKEAQNAGADFVGFEEYVEKIKAGWLGVDIIVATPDVMPEVGKLGKILGTKGMMPTPKNQTVTFDVGPAVKSLKAGKIQFKTDKAGNLHVGVGKVSFDKEKLRENIMTFLGDVLKLRPATAKGLFLKTVSVSSTMGPGFKIDAKEITETARKGG